MHKFFRKKQAKELQSSLKKTDTATESLEKQTANVSSVKLLSQCSEVTMEKFVRCICDNDLNQLVVEGEANANQLAEAWANLFLEYCDLSEAHETKYRLRLQAEIHIYKRKNEICQAWIDILMVKPSINIIESLKIVGYDYDFDINDPVQFMYDLKQVEADLRAERFDIKVKEAEYSSIMNATQTSDTVDRKYFTTIFTRINNYSKREAVNMQTTVEMYCASLRDFVSFIQSQSTTNA
jgi:hypothetical protein